MCLLVYSLYHKSQLFSILTSWNFSRHSCKISLLFFVSPCFQGHTVLTSDEPLQRASTPPKHPARPDFTFQTSLTNTTSVRVLFGTSSIFAFCVFSTSSLWTPGHRVRGHYRQSLDRNVCIHTGAGQHCPGLLRGQGRSGRCLLNHSSFLPSLGAGMALFDQLLMDFLLVHIYSKNKPNRL